MAYLAVMKGFILSLSMIVPIGSQNAMLLSRGINKNHHLMTAALFIFYDTILMSLGVFGGSLILSSNALLFTLLTWGGILFLCGYGMLSFKSALAGLKGETTTIESKKSVKVIILTSLVVTFLNPHAYIDTIMVIGSVGGQYQGQGKVYFLIGALAASVVWFSTLSLGAAKLSVQLSQPKTKSIIDAVIGVVMFIVAATLLNTWLSR